MVNNSTQGLNISKQHVFGLISNKVTKKKAPGNSPELSFVMFNFPELVSDILVIIIFWQFIRAPVLCFLPKLLQ